jgi:AraC-like DNA-binding protein/ligand-binding sensor protein
MNTNKEMVEQLAGSELFQEYERAYGTATGLPLAFRPLETFDLPFHGKRMENAFCAMMARRNSSCSACLLTQDKLRQAALEKTATVICAHGLCEAAVPVRLGDKVIGFLQTGQVLLEKPSSAKVEKVVAHAREQGSEEKPEALRDAYLKTPVISREKFLSTLQLLNIFGELLSIKSNQVAVAQANAESPVVTKAKKIIQDRHAEELSLGQVAQEVHVSPFYLCKLFRKATGMTFTEFVSRTRMEKAKSLLLNPNLRVSEIVYEVGFQSLTHFNRVFKKMMGESPTGFRSRIPGHRQAPASLGNCLRLGRNARAVPHFA